MISPQLLDRNYDSIFEPAMPGRPAKLRIRLKVALIPLDPTTPWARTGHSAQWPVSTSPLPPSHIANTQAQIKRGNVVEANGTGVPCRSWLAAEWTEFTQRFKHTVESGWNNQMKFVPVELGGSGGELSDADFRLLIGNPKLAAHVEGELEVDLQPPNNCHALIEVAHVATPGATFRQRMTRVSDECVQFHQHTFNYGAARGVTGVTGQIAAVHEVGHWLRKPGERLLTHIDQDFADTLPAAQRDGPNYGKTLGRYNAIMGGGSLATPYEARPWINRLKNHTDLKSAWLFVHRIEFNNGAIDIADHQKRLSVSAVG
jgi:hypothetical protein